MATAPGPFPPGDHDVVVIGSGPGGLQTSYALRQLGVAHAVLSADTEPGGMFRRYPIFQRLVTWTKIHAPVERGTRAYERYDWNSLIGDEPAHRALVPEGMDGTSYFPARAEMEAGLVAFAERAAIEVRYDCRWESTRHEDDRFVLTTSDGEYRCEVLVVAVGMNEPWVPTMEGIELAAHYAQTSRPKEYAGKRVFLLGKQNSGFELADGLLPWAKQLILASPRPARISVLTHSTAAARARYLQPYEDHVLGGGCFVLDAAPEKIEKTATGYRVHAKGTTRPGDLVFEVDEVIAATGFRTPLVDLPELGVATFYSGRLPAQTPFWESPSVPGIYFAGSVTQGAIGLKKYGIPSNSAAVHGFRYNARVLARHIAEHHFGVPPMREPIAPSDAVGQLLEAATNAPELWNQQSYLARVIEADGSGGAVDVGIVPLSHFVDSDGADAIAVTLETDATGDIHPAVYVRRGDAVGEHLLPGDTLLRFDTGEHRAQLTSVLHGLFEKELP